MDALIIVDMQVGLRDGAPKQDLANVVSRINALSDKVRRDGGKVIWIRHCGSGGDAFERGAPGWAFLPELQRGSDDLVIEKMLNDPYVGTTLGDRLTDLKPERVLVTGWATDYCVDATVRSTVSRDHHVVIVADAHTLSDRPHIRAADAIAYHNWLWPGLITNRTIRVASTRELLAELAG